MARRWKRMEDPRSTGRCGNCRRQRDLWKGICHPCAKPVEIRDLVEAGIPFGTLGSLMTMAKKCKTDKETQRILEMVHPVVMENVVVKNGIMKRRDPKYCWLRRNGWVK